MYSAIVVLVLFPIIIPVNKLDIKRKSIVLNYDIDESANKPYAQLTEALGELKKCSVIWRVNAEGAISDWNSDWKRNAGASNLINWSRSFVFNSTPK